MTQEKILVKDREDIVEITYADILKYHGKEMIGGAALVFLLLF